jgi:DNA repair photolyase
MNVKEIHSKTILSTSKVYDYVINPYVGCQHACSYCYARYMKRFTAHKEPWGQFVDVKVNAADLLCNEIIRKKRAKVWVSGVCDPYQPLERKYQLTRKCLEILTQNGWPVVVQTRSSLILRDLNILKGARDCEIGLTVTTANDDIRKWFEPSAPSIGERLRSLVELHSAGIRTYAMIAPILPDAEGLPKLFAGHVDYILVDRMNYNHADWVYRKYGLEDKLTDGYFRQTEREIVSASRKVGIECRVTF